MKYKTFIQLLTLAIALLLAGCGQEKEPVAVTGVTLSQTSLTMTEGDIQTLSATVQPSNADNKSVSWSSSNASVASVQDGVVTAHKIGSATITVKTSDGGKTANCSVTVTSNVISVSGVSLDKTSLELTEGDEATLTAIVSPDNASNKNVIWASSDTEVTTVEDGKVTAVKAGTATITVKTEDGDKTAACEVTVKEKVYPVESVSLDKTSLELTEGDEATLTAIVSPDNASNKDVAWTSSNPEVATVKNGKVTAVKAGTATITVKTEDGDKSATCEVIVNANEPEIPIGEYMNLSQSGTANSYIVSASGYYKFTPTKGNSNTSVAAIASACILWESFGTSMDLDVGDLVKNAAYYDGYITFKTAETFKEGNAVIAAKDTSGNILWSWHIWLTDEPQSQEYYNNAGIMMDRNLGATSATPGDVKALGLLYQWGRKDPFLGSSLIRIDNNVEAKSTISWPSTVSSDSINGTIEYTTAHPTTFITSNSKNQDWYYTGDNSTDDTRWTTSESEKSIYDPCPAGWRVPDGGSNGIWSIAGFSSTTYDRSNKGISFYGTWYPATGCRSASRGNLSGVAKKAYYWSTSPNNQEAYALYFNEGGGVTPFASLDRAIGNPVRCVQE